jgi:hypothetical protein
MNLATHEPNENEMSPRQSVMAIRTKELFDRACSENLEFFEYHNWLEKNLQKTVPAVSNADSNG